VKEAVLMTVDTRATATRRFERSRVAAEAAHTLAMEGMEVPTVAREDARRYVEGQLTPDEMVHRARARHGLGT
jgi:hypothetical protein